ncbi:MAG: hypothetical protein R3F30_02570 [Planctomycetota bacterium]
MLPFVWIMLGVLLLPFQGKRMEVTLTTGKVVVGEVLQEDDKALILETDLGTLMIPVEKIEARRVLTKDGKPVAEAEPQGDGKQGKKKDDPFALEKIVAELEKKGEAEGGDEAKPEAKGDAAADGAAQAERPEAPAGAAPTPRTAPDEEKVDDGRNALWPGRLIDNYVWVRDLQGSSKIGILAALFLLFTFAIRFLGRLLDIEYLTTGRSMASGLIWLAILLGIMMIPNPTIVIAGVVGFLLLVAWMMTTRGLMGASWIQAIQFLFLGAFGVLLLILLVEVGEHILALKVQ